MQQKWSVGRDDILRVEEKINSALRDKREGKEGRAKDRIKSLHAYLEEMEDRESLSRSTQSGQNVRPAMGAHDQHLASTNDKLVSREKEYMSALSQNKAMVASLQVELTATKNDLETLKQVLENERAASKLKEEHMLSKLNQREEDFSREITTTVTRQHETIGKLVSDKQALSEQVSSLLGQIKMSDQKSSKLIQDLKEKFKADMKEAQKEWINSEKAKREKWKQDKEKEIKEMTIKGLEPEVERMLARQRDDKIRLEEEASEQVRQAKSKLEGEYQTRLDEFKQRVLTENESLLNREKGLLQTHYETLLKEGRESIRREVVELEERMNREIDDMQGKLKREKSWGDERVDSIRKEYEERLERVRKEREEERAEWMRRVAEERENGKKSIEIEEARKKMEAEKQRDVEIRVGEVKRELERERDLKINKIVEKLLREKADEIEAAVQGERNRLKEKKTQNDGVIEDLRTELTIYKERVIEEKGVQNKLIDESVSKQKTIDKLLKENEEQRQQIVRLRAQVKGLEEEVTQEKTHCKTQEKIFADQIELERRKTQETRQEVHEVMSRHKEEKELLTKELEERQVLELESLERRVKSILERKESELNDLRQELDSRDALCLKYEQLLDKQRRDLLGGIN